MTDMRNRNTDESRRFWDHAEKKAAAVAGWPEWKKGGVLLPREQSQGHTVGVDGKVHVLTTVRARSPAYICEHANECPSRRSRSGKSCPCAADCYCKMRTCKHTVLAPARVGYCFATPAKCGGICEGECGAPSPRPAPRDRPKVGVSILVRRADGRILVGLRKGSHGAGTWSPPGGHLEGGESVEECAVRELAEETGIVVDASSVRALSTWTHDREPAAWGEYVTLWCVVSVPSGTEADIMEPEKCGAWCWVPRGGVPAPLFRCFASLIARVDPWNVDGT